MSEPLPGNVSFSNTGAGGFKKANVIYKYENAPKTWIPFYIIEIPITPHCVPLKQLHKP